MAFCRQCGNKLEEGAEFCPSCGNPTAKKQAPANPAPQQPAPNPQYAQDPSQGYAQQGYAQPNPGYAPQQGTPNVQQFSVDMGRDFTHTFSPQDISDNKIFALVAYLLSPIGIVVTLLAAQKSPFAMFHAREATKLFVAQILMYLFAMLLFFLIIPLILAFIGSFVFLIINIVCIVRAAKGQAKLAPLVGGMAMFK